MLPLDLLTSLTLELLTNTSQVRRAGRDLIDELDELPPLQTASLYPASLRRILYSSLSSLRRAGLQSALPQQRQTLPEPGASGKCPEPLCSRLHLHRLYFPRDTQEEAFRDAAFASQHPECAAPIAESRVLPLVASSGSSPFLVLHLSH